MRYLELTFAVRQETVEEAAEIVRRHVPAGVSIDVPFEAIDEEGGFSLYNETPIEMRAWLPAEDGDSSATLAALRRDLRALDGLVRPLRSRSVDDASWADAWKRYFTVLHVGKRLVLRPSWRRYRARRDDVVIDLDPGMAFGTGQHATTRMCLETLEERMQPGALVLDVGTGSGILAVTAALLGAAAVDAVDIDSIAVRAASENAARNRAEVIVRVAAGSLGKAWPFGEPPTARYDLALANLSSRLVQELASPLVETLRPGGVALVSGLIEEHETACRSAIEGAGGRVVETRSDGPWRLFVVERDR